MSRDFKFHSISFLKTLLLALLSIQLLAHTTNAQTRELALQFLPADTSITFTLGDTFHTVHGSFKLKKGNISYDSAGSRVAGSLVVDATSGQTNNRTRDRRMHREILESGRYSEITFKPDRIEGSVASSGNSTLQVHGTFTIHGADHEVTIPVRVQVYPDHWIADAHFNVPYVAWGIKNPSTWLLRVSESVELDVHATGVNPYNESGTH